MTDLERANAELRAAVIIAGKLIVKLNIGRRFRAISSTPVSNGSAYWTQNGANPPHSRATKYSSCLSPIASS
jgi:hypothetical protein